MHGFFLVFVTFVCSLVDAAPLDDETPFRVSLINPADVDFQKFSGIWYTIWKSKEFVDPDSARIESKVFYADLEGPISYFKLNSGRKESTCLGGNLNKENGIYITDDNVAITIVSTNYHSTALLMYCTNFTDSQCLPNHHYFEIASRTRSMEPSDEIRIMTEINELLGKFEEMTFLGAKCEGGSPTFDSVGVARSFSLEDVLGDSTTLAQTDFIGTSALLSHNIYLPQIDRVVGWFVFEDKRRKECGPVFRAITKVSSENKGILYSRIGHLESQTSWSVSRTLYSDRNYTLSYFCYGKYNTSCPKAMTEIRLNSRLSDIDSDFKRTLYQLLQKVCLKAEDMKSLHYELDCRPNFRETVNKEKKYYKNSVGDSCDMEYTPVANYKHEKEQLDGIWYVVASVNEIPGQVLNFTTLPDSLIVDMCTPNNDTCQWFARHKYAQICPGKAKFIETYPMNKQKAAIVERSFAYITNETQILYSCPHENEGKCDTDTIVVRVYSREKQLTDSTKEKVESFLPFLCLNISDLTIAQTFPSLTFPKAEPFQNYSKTACSLQSIPFIHDFNQSKILGTWYQLAYSEIPVQKNGRATHPVEFTEDKSGRLKLLYKYTDNETEEYGSFVGDIYPQCYDYGGHYSAKYTFSAIVNILYTDYENLTIIHVCSFINANGVCSLPLVHIMSRNKELTTEMFRVAESVLGDCVDTDNLLIVQDVSSTEYNNTVTIKEWKSRQQSG
ncbi:uncharacterized protein LOC115224175 [Argonauta hians]